MKDRKKSRELILASAEREFSSKGLHKTKIIEIARGAGLSAGSLYNLFENKEDIFISLVKDRLSSFRKGVEDCLKGEDTERRLVCLISAILVHMKETGGFLRNVMMMEDTIRSNILGEARRELDATLIGIHRTITSIMKDGEREGCLKGYPPEVLAASFMGVAISILHNELLSPSIRDEESLMGTIMDIFLNGARKGRT